MAELKVEAHKDEASKATQDAVVAALKQKGAVAGILVSYKEDSDEMEIDLTVAVVDPADDENKVFINNMRKLIAATLAKAMVS